MCNITDALCWHLGNTLLVHVTVGGDIRDIRQAVLDHSYDKDPPVTHRAARVCSGYARQSIMLSMLMYAKHICACLHVAKRISHYKLALTLPVCERIYMTSHLGCVVGQDQADRTVSVTHASSLIAMLLALLICQA